MSNFFQNSFEYKLIYIFEVSDEAHRGLLKIGDTTLQTDKVLSVRLNVAPSVRLFRADIVPRKALQSF